MSRFCRWGAFIAVCIALAAPAGAAEYYVSPGGNDATGDGSQAHPWKTIQKAADTMSAGDTCHVLDGDYAELVRPARSGTAGQYISFVADGPAASVVGTRPITGWTVHSGSVWKANVTSDFDDLFVDRQRMVIARWPNLTSGDVYRPTFYQATANGGDTSIIDADHLTQSSGYWTWAKIFMVPGLGWTADQRNVTGYDPTSHQISFSPAITASAYYDADQYSLYFLYDKLSLLDAPSEWFLDRTTHTVYVWLPDGSDPNAHLVESSGGSGGFDLTGRSYIRVAGFKLTSGDIRMLNATGCLVEEVRHLYPAAELSVSGSDNVITRSEIAYASGTGVRLAGTRNTLSKCHVHHCDYLGANSLVDLGNSSFWPSGGSQNSIVDCSLHDGGHEGVNVVPPLNLAACLIEHNEIYNVGLIAKDLGGFYCWGTNGGGTEIKYNIVHDVWPEPSPQYGPLRLGYGIYLDESSSGFSVHHNVVYRTGGYAIFLHQPSRNNLVYNNTAVGSGGGWGDVINSSPGGSAGVDGTVLVNNVAAMLDDREGWSVNYVSEAPVYHHNGYFNLLYSDRRNNQGVEATGVTGNPLFTNAAGNDFSLLAGSPMIDKGWVIPGVTDGYLGAAPDIGAYQRGGSERPGPRYQLWPTIGLSESALSYVAAPGSTSVLSQSVAVSNTGAGTLNWTVSASAAWLRVAPAGGTGTGTLQVSADPTGLPLGIYTGTVTVADAAATNSPQTIAVSLAIAGDCWVSPGGSDTTGDGSQARPWKTIQKAADTMSAGDTCHVLDGDYAELVRPARSGAAGQYISFVADGSAAYVVGTRRITGWTVHSGSVWKANVTSDFDDLFVDRQRMVIARWPNLTTGDVYRPNFFQATANGGDTSIIDANHLTQASGYWDGAKIFMVPGGGWVADQRLVTGYDSAAHRMTFSPAISNAEWYDADQHSLYFLYDKLSLLDAPSEWFLDRTTHTVYVWLPDGSNPNTHLVEASGGSAGFDLTGRSYVRVSGVSVINGNISLVNATGCRVEGVRHLYPVTELKMSGSDNVITQSEIAYAGYTGVRIAGERNTISRCHIHHCDYLGATTAEYFGFDGLVQFGFKEVWPPLVNSQNTVADCSLHDAGRDGVIAQSDISACVLEHNEIYNTGLIALDTGGVYTSTMDAGGTVLRYNIVHDIRPRDSDQWGAPASPGNGIYLDEASANFVVHHNLVYGVPSSSITLHQASRYNLVYNNTAVGSGGGWGDIINSTPGGRWFGVEGTEVANNLAVILDGRAGLDNRVPWCINFQSEIPAYHHNGYYNPLDSQKLHSQGLEATAVVGNPLFTNAAANDFSLQAGSPMIDKGAPIPGITDGYVGAAPDIGAYERGSSEVPGLRYAVGPPAPALKGYYVSPSGNDTIGDGSQARPWQTIQRAADAMAPGDTCHVQDGDYAELVRPARSGAAGQYISFVADGASVTLAGTRAITGWTVHSGNIWKATVTTDFDDLFVDRQRMIAARWPNLESGDPYRPTFFQATANGGDTSVIDSNHLTQPGGYWDGAKIFMVPGLGWVADQRSVTGYDPATHQLTFSPAISNADYYDADQYTQYFLYDKLSLLDAPSEWFLDRTTHTVYVWLPDGSDPNGHLVEASAGPAGFDLTNRSYVRVTGFKIFGGDIRLLRATGCVVENVWHLYPTAELLVSGSDNVITRSEIAYTNYAGVRLTGTRNTLSKSQVHHCNYYGSANAIVEFGNNNFWPNGGSENAVTDCSLHDSGRDGVTLVSSTDLSVRTLLVEHNEIYNTGLVTRTSDGFHNWNRDAGGTIVRYNIIHDIWPIASPQYGGVAVGNGINLGDNSSNFAVHHNVLYRVPATVISLRQASTNNLVYNNTLVGSGGGWGDLVNSSPGSIGSGVAGTEVANNLAVNLDGRWAWGINFQTAVPAYHHNGYYNPSTDTRNNSQGVETTGVVANPLFTDAAGHDFSLLATSPMIDKGAVVAGITDGYLGAFPDIGAYEREATERPGLRYVAPWLVFTDDPLVARATPIRAIHVAELRVVIDRLRQAHGLSRYAWTDATLVAGVTMVKAVQVMELRTALNAVYVAMGRTSPSYGDTLTPGATIIATVHIAELRAAVRAIW